MTSLSAQDKDTVRAFWSKVSGKSSDIGVETLARMFAVYPQTKTYFTHWKDLSPGSEPVRSHGGIFMKGVSEAVNKIDNMTAGLLNLSELHAFTLRVDPANFKWFTHSLMVSIAVLFPKDFTPEVHVSFDKFMACVARALAERYR